MAAVRNQATFANTGSLLEDFGNGALRPGSLDEVHSTPFEYNYFFGGNFAVQYGPNDGLHTYFLRRNTLGFILEDISKSSQLTVFTLHYLQFCSKFCLLSSLPRRIACIWSTFTVLNHDNADVDDIPKQNIHF